MRSHQVAAMLEHLAKILRSLPNQNLETALTRTPPDSELPLALSTLIKLSSVDKAQWAEFIRKQNLPVAVTPRDSSRDIVGRLLRYLERHPEATKRLVQSARR